VPAFVHDCAWVGALTSVSLRADQSRGDRFQC
jgi:hypothetical protein